jgi:hypothetical protein
LGSCGIAGRRAYHIRVFIFLNTPLNPFKGRDDGSAGEVNHQNKEAFFEDLANNRYADQIII